MMALPFLKSQTFKHTFITLSVTANPRHKSCPVSTTMSTVDMVVDTLDMVVDMVVETPGLTFPHSSL